MNPENEMTGRLLQSAEVSGGSKQLGLLPICLVWTNEINSRKDAGNRNGAGQRIERCGQDDPFLWLNAYTLSLSFLQ